MYKRFYGLQRSPFEITPDPTFLFSTKRHNEALAALYYGVRRRKGFVVMTGEVGTGKTLLVRCLLQLLNQSQVAYAYVFNPRLSPVEFLQYIVGDFGLPVSGKNKSELLLQLGSFVISRYQKGLSTVLVVDEAHHLSADVLEEVRLLTNLETPNEKLLQILLVGQPELDDVLDSVKLRQLKQRIALRPRLEPLELSETEAYVYRRLQKAGCANPAVIFPMDTILEIHEHSRGIPRLINTLCETALIHGYANQIQAITPAMIQEIAVDFRLNVVRPVPRENHLADETSEVRQAAKTLLDLYSQLRRAESTSDELRMPVRTRTTKNEPYI